MLVRYATRSCLLTWSTGTGLISYTKSVDIPSGELLYPFVVLLPKEGFATLFFTIVYDKTTKVYNVFWPTKYTQANDLLNIFDFNNEKQYNADWRIRKPHIL